jgi:hypothetical protein
MDNFVEEDFDNTIRTVVTDDGYVRYVTYTLKDNTRSFHRVGGPARIWEYSNGEMKECEYWLNGKYYDNTDEYRKDTLSSNLDII